MSDAFVDPYIGKKYGKRTVISYIDTLKAGRRYLVRCECGYESAMYVKRLIRGLGKQCFVCLRRTLKREQLARKSTYFALGNGKRPKSLPEIE